MTSRMLTPWWVDRRVDGRLGALGSVDATSILDFHSAGVRSFASELGEAADIDGRGYLQRAHSLIVDRVRPVYALNDLQPVFANAATRARFMQSAYGGTRSRRPACRRGHAIPRPPHRRPILVSAFPTNGASRPQ